MLPVGAQASTASLAFLETEYIDPGGKGSAVIDHYKLSVMAAPGEVNQIVLSRDEGVTVRDEGATISPGPGCVAEDGHGVRCALSAGKGGGYVPAHVDLGDGDDTLEVGPGFGPTSFEFNLLLGGPGDDRISSESRVDWVDGGAGSDALSGGPGADVLLYSGRTAPVSVSFNDLPDDGEAGEGDSPAPDFEHVLTGQGDDVIDLSGLAFEPSMVRELSADGGAGNDTLIGSPGPDTLYGRSGDDHLFGAGGLNLLVGGDGADWLRGGAGLLDRVSYQGSDAGVTVTLNGQPDDGRPDEHDLVGPGIEAIVGSPYDDVIVGNSRPNWLEGDGGRDVIYGRKGDDRIQSGSDGGLISGGPGVDFLLAWSSGGTTTIEARDGEQDRISCSGGYLLKGDDFEDLSGCPAPPRWRSDVVVFTSTAYVKRDGRGRLQLSVAARPGPVRVSFRLVANEVRIGGGRFRLPTSDVRHVRFKLSRLGMRLLRRASRLRVVVLFKGRDRNGERLAGDDAFDLVLRD